VTGLVAPGPHCAVDEFGTVDEVEGHGFFSALYDLTPTPHDPLHPLHYRRVVIFERAGSGPAPSHR
jgi:hypothetical protein